MTALLIVASLVLGWFVGVRCVLWWMKETFPTAFYVLVQEMKWRKAERQTEKAKQERKGEQ